MAAEKSISFVVLWNNAQLPDVILKSQEINVMWPIFCPVTVGLGLLTRSQHTTIVFSVDILLSTMEMQELRDIRYCKCEETTSSDYGWKRGRYQTRFPSWKKKIFRYLFLVGGGGVAVLLYHYNIRILTYTKDSPADRPSGKVFRDWQWKEHGIQALLYYILVVVME